MNQNLVIGLLAVVIVIGGGAWLVNAGYLAGTTATSTPQSVTNTNGQTPAADVAASPVVTTGTLVVASNSSAVLTGKVFPNGAQTSYWYEYGSTSSLGARTTPQAIGSGFVNISAPAFISGLAARSPYFYRLVAENSFGTVSGTTYSFTTNSNPPPTGSAPAVHTDAASSILRSSVNLNGHVTPNGADTSYWFEYGPSNSLGNTASFQSAGSGNNSLEESAAVSGLQPLTTYYFRIDAQNQFGTVTGATQSFTTGGPAAPSAPSADTTSASRITATTAVANGRVNPNGAPTTYWFEYGTDSLLGNILGTTTHQSLAGSGTSQVSVSSSLTGLARNTNYSYRLVTSNSYGTVSGNIVSFKTSVR